MMSIFQGPRPKTVDSILYVQNHVLSDLAGKPSRMYGRVYRTGVATFFRIYTDGDAVYQGEIRDRWDKDAPPDAIVLDTVNLCAPDDRIEIELSGDLLGEAPGCPECGGSGLRGGFHVPCSRRCPLP